MYGREIATDEPHQVKSRRQVFDLPKPQLQVTEHRLGSVECCGQKQCVQIVKSAYPADVDSPVQYGAETKEQLKQAQVAHFDETGLQVGCKLYWLHTVGNAWYTHLFVHQKRGEQALQSAASVLKDFVGWAIHDDWPAYYKFNQAQHGACNAHILREL